MFYDKYVKLCNSVGKTPSAVALEIGIEKSTVTRWKSGKSQTDKNIQKVADFFGVSVEWLKGDDDLEPGIKRNPTALTDDGMDDSTKRLLEIFMNASDAERAELLGHAEYLASKKSKGE